MSIVLAEIEPFRQRRTAARAVTDEQWQDCQNAIPPKQLAELDRRKGRGALRVKIEGAVLAHRRAVAKKSAPRQNTRRQLDSLRRQCWILLDGLAKRIGPEARSALRVANGDLSTKVSSLTELLAIFEKASACVPADIKPQQRMRSLIERLDKIIFEAMGQHVTRSTNKTGCGEFARRCAQLANVENASINEAIRHVTHRRRK